MGVHERRSIGGDAGGRQGRVGVDPGHRRGEVPQDVQPVDGNHPRVVRNVEGFEVLLGGLGTAEVRQPVGVRRHGRHRRAGAHRASTFASSCSSRLIST